MSDQIHSIPRDLLEKYFEKDPRLISAFEAQSEAVETIMDPTTGAVQATSALQNATVITLSSNAVFNSEFILTNGDGTALEIAEGTVSIRVDDTVARTSGPKVTFVPPGPVTLGLPGEGTLISDAAPATLSQKTLDKPLVPGLVDAVSQAAAAAAGVPMWGMYRDGNDLKVRNI